MCWAGCQVSLMLFDASTPQVATAIDLCDDWNKALQDNVQIIRAANSELRSKFEASQISSRAFIAGFQAEPKPVKPPTLQWGRWFLQKYGWSLLSRCSDQQSWLPFNHPEMIAARQAVQDLFDAHNVHPAMVLNFDQLWRQSWSFTGKLLLKDRKAMGCRRNRSKCSKRADKKLHAVKGNRRSMTVPWFLTKHFVCSLFVCPGDML